MRIDILLYLKAIFFVCTFAKISDNSHSNAIATTAMPFMVSIQVKKGWVYEHFCGGSIIHRNFVLTAAHCFHEYNELNALSVVGGSNQLNIDKSDHRRKVIHLLLHHSYMPLFGYDIAIIKVHPEFDFTDKRYAKINYLDESEKDIRNGTQTWLLGWGRSNLHLETVHFEIITTELCRSKGFKYVTKTEVCAVSFKGRGACDGDSGGPLVSQNFKLLLGLLSFGKSVCQPKRIYAFTWLKPLISWINKNINETQHFG